MHQEVPGGVTRHLSAVTADAGLFWEVSDLIGLGVSGFNLVPTGHEALTAPRSVGAGLMLGSDTSVKLTADWRADLDRVRDPAGRARTSNRYGAGLEILLGDIMPVRAGYLKDETLDTTWWSAGFGLITNNGVAIDVGYRQSVETPDARTISVAFKLQFLEPR
jgi:hypothetical protein